MHLNQKRKRMKQIPITALKEKMPVEINSLFTSEIGRIKQVFKVITKNSSNPVLLFLNGGPLESHMLLLARLTGMLKDKYTVILWDQRGAGRTRKLNPTETIPKLNQMFTDTHEVIRLFLDIFKKEKIYLAGHSFGTVLGFNIVKTHPELLNCFFAVSPVIHAHESNKLLLEKLNEHNKIKKNKKALKELSTVQLPYTQFNDWYFYTKWCFFIEGQWFFMSRLFRLYLKSIINKRLPIMHEFENINLTESLKEIKCPVYFLLGEKDLVTSSDLAKEYFNIINASLKEIYIFPGVGHNVPLQIPKKVSDIFVDKINS
jgi:pimeloyl-ACP methyl ester carboxylesterase